MAIKPRGGTWQVSVGSGAKRKRVAAKTREEAEAIYAELLAEHQRAQQPLNVAGFVESGKTIQDAYNAAERDVWRGTKGARTAGINGRAWVDHFGPETLLSAITTEMVKEAVAEFMEGGNTGGTANRKLSALSVMLKGARENGWIAAVPELPRKRENEHRIHWFTEAEEEAMIAGAQQLGMPELATFITVAIDTGFRRSELLGLEVSNLHAGLVHLHAGATKSGRARAVPATAAVAEAFREAQAAQRGRLFAFNDQALRRMWDDLRTLLGKQDDPGFLVHTLRHTTATRLAVRGATSSQIMAYMGHTQITTSMRYVHLAVEHVRGLEKLLERGQEPNRPGLRIVGGTAA